MVEFKGKFDENVQKSIDKRAFKTVSIVILVLCAIIFVIGIIGLIWRQDREDLFGACYCIAFSVLFYPLWVGIYAIMRKFINPNMTVMSAQTEQQFQFFEDRFICSQIKGEEFNDFLQAKYSVLFKVVETKEQYFLYISRAQCYVINKADITAGSVDELNKILASNLGENFKKLKTKENIE